MTQLTRQHDGQPLPLLDLSLPATRSRGMALVRDLSQMAKPRITLMVVITAFIGYSYVPGAASLGWLTLMATLVGTALSCMGASALNQAMERELDARMPRTAQRPLPTGRVSMSLAVGFGLLLAIAGVVTLLALTTPLAGALSALTVLSYTLIYTPLKRITSACTIIGAVPGALPPVIGYAAAAGYVGIEAWVMFGILFLWQLPHFLAIAWMYRDDYAAAGMPMLPVIDSAQFHATCRQILLGCLALLPLGLLPTVIGFTGMIYFFGALAAGLMFLAFGIRLILNHSRENARALFLASLVYLPLVFVLMLVDRVSLG